MLNALPFSNRFLPHKEMPAANEIDQRTMRGSCWNPTEPMALTSGQSQQRIDQQQQQQVMKDERQQSLLSAATPAWGLMLNGPQKESQRSGPNSPTETASFAHPTFGGFDFGSQVQSTTSPSYSSPESSLVKAEPQEHPEYDSGRETLNDGEEDDMIEMSPEVLVQAELSSESKEVSNAVKQTPKRQVTRKLLKCPMCNFESDTTNRDFFMDHLITHCAMANRAPINTPNSNRSEEDQAAEEDAENEFAVEDDASLRMPQITSQGNVKFYRCKKCKAPSLTKYDSWIHQREHMTPEKILYCKVCPFATEYKHHLEYHMRNHYGSKPFKCPKCNYTCVNKSMLNSHLKSHSSIYQYRCASCSYVTKYCHSLKVHLKRNMHEPAVVLNPDGTPNPNPIIDVNSSRRGPRTKPQNCPNNSLNAVIASPESSPKYESQVAPLPIYPETTYTQYSEESKPTNQLYFNGQYETQNLYNSNLRRDILEQTYRQNQQALVQNASLNFMATNPEQFAAFQKNLAIMGYMKMIQEMRAPQIKGNESDPEEPENNSEKLNESWSSTSEPLDLSNKSDTNSVDGNSPAKRRRKGVAIKLGKPSNLDSDSESRVEIESLNGSEDNNDKPNEDLQGRIMVYKNGVKQNMYFCRICDIIFRNEVMFTIHMGYHGRSDPLSCNICGERCPDHVTFFVHVTRNEH